MLDLVLLRGDILFDALVCEEKEVNESLHLRMLSGHCLSFDFLVPGPRKRIAYSISLYLVRRY